MTVEITYSQARNKLAALCDLVTSDREIVKIRRRNAEDVVLIAADELASLLETAHLMRSPRNAERLLAALERARQQTVAPQSVEELRREVGLDSAA